MRCHRDGNGTTDHLVCSPSVLWDRLQEREPHLGRVVDGGSGKDEGRANCVDVLFLTAISCRQLQGEFFGQRRAQMTTALLCANPWQETHTSFAASPCECVLCTIMCVLPITLSPPFKNFDILNTRRPHSYIQNRSCHLFLASASSALSNCYLFIS